MAVDNSSRTRAEAQSTVKELFDFITAQGNGDYIGEKVSQLQHSLQAATLAQNAGADEETVLGALLHDVGRFIPAGEKMAAMIADDGTYVGRQSHEVVGEQYLRNLGFSDKICQLVGAHVMAKRYLTGVSHEYYEGLSSSSKTTLKFQVSESMLSLSDADNSRADLLPSKRSRRRRKIHCWRPNLLFGDGTTRLRIRKCARHHSTLSKAWRSNH